MKLVRTFDEIGIKDIDLVGGKGANLGEMTRAGFSVPPGFCLTVEAYRQFIACSEAARAIASFLAELRLDDIKVLENQTARLREFLITQPMPSEIAKQALDAYHALARRLDAPPHLLRVAVRSSATAEDLPGASFAGQQETYLNICGDDALLEHIKRCWASLWTARAVSYRHAQGFDQQKVALAVVVQAMIEADVAGILFTANPVNQRRDEIVINASWGLGEAVVSGLVTPDTFIVRKHDGGIVAREIATKDRAIRYAADVGTHEVELPPERRTIPSLSDAEVLELARLGERIETYYRAPMDVEWALRGGKFYILQARPITTLDAKERTTDAHPFKPPEGGPGGSPTGEYNRTMFVEIFPDPLSPAFLSVIVPLFQSMLDFTFETLGFRPPKGIPAVGVFYNQPYFHREYIAAALEPLSPNLREALVAQIINPFSRHPAKLPLELSPAYLGMVARLLRFMTGFPQKLPGLLAEYRAAIQKVAAINPAEHSDAELIGQIRPLLFTHASKLLNYDFLMIAAIGITYQMLGTLLERYFGEQSQEIRAKLISGVTGNVTMETNKRLWDLAQNAKRADAVRATLVRSGNAELRSALEQIPDGRVFLAELDAFLEQYGHREIRMDILYPTWGEDPTPVLSFLRSYLELDESASPHRQQERLVRERIQLAQQVEARLRRDWAGRFVLAPLFKRVLENTQAHTRERDTMHFELTRLFPPLRRILLEVGRRWQAQNVFDAPDDIFFLTLEEMEMLARDLSSPPSAEKSGWRDMHAIVQARRAEFAASQQSGAPPILCEGKPVETPEIASRTVTGQYQGIAGSPGHARGAVRVIRGPDEFHKLERGDILVAPLTNPVWTPLFAIAGGVVTEVGGILSHGAIVAREYGIPAVMAVKDATKLLHDGEHVTVDGDKGIVTRDGF